MVPESTNGRRFPAPAMFYGTLGQAGKGWRSVARRAWNTGWKEALEGVEYLDLYQSPGPIIHEEKPTGFFRQRYETQPYFAAYCIHQVFSRVAFHALENTSDVRETRFRFRDRLLEALDYPWYSLGVLWPSNGFLPPYDPCFSSDSEWEEEKRRVALTALRKIVRHFQLVRLLETRFTLDGIMPVFPVGKLNIRVTGVLCHCMDLGMPKGTVERFAFAADLEAERILFQWMNENGYGGKQ
jgi:hypothetical protein